MFVWADLIEVVVFLRFEQVEGLPLLLTGSSQQVVKHMVVPKDTHKHNNLEELNGKNENISLILISWIF